MESLDKHFLPFLEAKSLSKSLNNYYLAEEGRCVRMLVREATPTDEQADAIARIAKQLVKAARERGGNGLNVDSFLKEFSLDNDEGISLMCLAEALIRVPDNETARMFIHDKLKDGNWQQNQGGAQKAFWRNASTWGLLFTGKIFKNAPEESDNKFKQLFQRLGSPIVLKAVQQAVNLISDQFVTGQTIELAYKATHSSRRYQYSYDMLGEAALIPEDADRYCQSYREAIKYLGAQPNKENLSPLQRPSVSIKLSALSAKFNVLRKQDLKELKERFLELVLEAKACDVAITIDAEESWLLEPTLELFADTLQHEALEAWPYLGLAVQAYQKRAHATLLWLKSLALKHQRSIPVRLVKGAYWDHEIKKAQQEGLSNYPVFTRKSHTDISFLACAQFILKHPDLFYGQFATHNAHTIASIHVYAQTVGHEKFELQRLHGMGESTYQEYLSLYPQVDCRVYAPVGKHKELLPYLVRRLLENGANSSFVRALNDDENYAIDDLVQEPSVLAMESGADHTQMIPLPREIYLPRRLNSVGLNLHSGQELSDLFNEMQPFLSRQYFGKDQDQAIRNPADRAHILGSRNLNSSQECQEALQEAHDYFPTWNMTSPIYRAERLELLAELIEEHRVHLIALLMTEIGKTLQNAHNEVREAIDFCRYYAAEVRDKFVVPLVLPGPTGEDNGLFFEGRGVFICISPGNFPVSIFLGQSMAALAAGNCVVAKPATDTELVTRKVAELIYAADIPKEAFQVIFCPSRIFATNLLSDSRVDGVAFTGSIETGRHINIQLAQRKSGIATTIMDTGGQNAMVVDSTALPEQVVKDIMRSAFDSAGQRCSALRVLFLQSDIADRILELLTKRLSVLKVGNPLNPEVDVGPVISENARNSLLAHLEYLVEAGEIVASAPLDPELEKKGFFVAPTIAELSSMSLLKQEIFGPVLHVIRFDAEQWDEVVDQINNAHYGLTLGIHSRIESRAYDLARRVRAGNIYINREMIGSTVGSQPFGGLGLSGTGPKSGGPNYVARFAAEKVISNNVAAMGGNLRLLSGGR